MAGKRKWLWISGIIVGLFAVSFILIRRLAPDLFPGPDAASGAAGSPGVSAEIPEWDDTIETKSFLTLVPVTFHADIFREIPLPEGEDAFSPRVSPDGSRIVFLSRKDGADRVVIAELPSGKTSPVNTGLADHRDPSWSVDGRKIVFAGVRDGNSDIYVYDLAANKLSQLTRSPGRKKTWPRFSPFPFDNNFRIAYTSEENGRKDIWWVRESGEYDQAITLPKEKEKEYRSGGYFSDYAPKAVNRGGDSPEWSLTGNVLSYQAEGNRTEMIAYDYGEWWQEAKTGRPSQPGEHILSSPNGQSFLAYDGRGAKAFFGSIHEKIRRRVLAARELTSLPAFFPDGQGLAFTFRKGRRSVLAIEPLDDPSGDIWNIGLFDLGADARKKLLGNLLTLRRTSADQIYELYERGLYDPNDELVIQPYLVTSDALLETFYAAFSALLTVAERTEYAADMKAFASRAVEEANRRNASEDARTFFLVGKLLLDPAARKGAPAAALREVGRIEKADAGPEPSLFGMPVNYSDFFIRGKYERDKDLQPYFRALKWFDAFTFRLDNPAERKAAAEIAAIVNAPDARQPLDRIHATLARTVGESRYYGPKALAGWKGGEPLPKPESTLPWILPEDRFRLFPAIYTMDAFIFDHLTSHVSIDTRVMWPEPIGAGDKLRLLPYGLDIAASFGSKEARSVLLDDFREGRFANYERRVAQLSSLIGSFPKETWERNLYTNWLGLLDTLIREPEASAPAFAKTKGWKRKQLNTFLGSWTNLRYETIGYVEQIGSEAGEGGYERLQVGRPRGYVEPNPAFFRALDEAFGRMGQLFGDIVADPELRKALDDRIGKYRSHVRKLETIAAKELKGEAPTDDECAEILYIGRTVEHFIKIMNNLGSATNPAEAASGLSNREPIRKVVDVQRVQAGSTRLYEALGHPAEIEVIVPYFGRRQVVVGPVYSYHEFRSDEQWTDAKWRATKNPPVPSWIAPYYRDGTAGSGKGRATTAR